MSASMTALQWRCDWCGTYSEQLPLAPSGSFRDTELPDGWTGITNGYGPIRHARWVELEMKDVWGTQISNLCPACSLRPVGDLLTHLSSLKPGTIDA